MWWVGEKLFGDLVFLGWDFLHRFEKDFRNRNEVEMARGKLTQIFLS